MEAAAAIEDTRMITPRPQRATAFAVSRAPTSPPSASAVPWSDATDRVVPCSSRRRACVAPKA